MKLLRKIRNIIVLGIVAGMLAVAVLDPPPAQAALVSDGPGFTSSFGDGTSSLRAFRLPNGTLVYCIDFTWGRPFDNQPLTFSVVNNIPGRGLGWGIDSGPTTRAVSTTDVGRMNFILTKYGQTGSNTQAAAVRAAMLYYTLSGVGNVTTYINQFADSLIATAAERNSVKALWQQYVSEASSATIGSVGTGDIVFDVFDNTYEGTVRVNPPVGIPTGTTGVITLTNGIFVETGTNILTDAVSGVEYEVLGVPPAGSTPYKIEAHATFAVPPGYGAAANIRLLTSQTGRQRVVVAGESISTFDAHGIDPFDRTTTFAPVVETVVANQYVQPGDFPTDRLSFHVGEVTDPATGEVFRNQWNEFFPGEYEPITAQGTLYGPSTTAFEQSATVPAGTPVHQTATLTTSIEDGPNRVYEVTGSTPITVPGYYTWVWEIAFNEQSSAARDYLPDDYYYAHDFGLVNETHTRPFEIDLSTQLLDNEVLMGSSTTDEVTVSLETGPWLQDANGNPLAVNLVGTVYYSSDEPIRSATPPSGVEAIQTLSARVTTAGTFTSNPILSPNRYGWVTVRWCTDPSQEFVMPECDDYGVPSETFRILGPQVSSLATQEAAPGSFISDQVIVSGPVPTSGLTLQVEAFLQEEDFSNPVCIESNRIFSSTPFTAEGTGTFTSETFQIDPDLPITPGGQRVIYFIETAMTSDGTVIHRGECGVEEERTIVRLPEVSSEALAFQYLGGAIADELIVTGSVPPGSTATVAAFLQDEETEAPVCVEENLVYQSDPVSIQEGLHSTSRTELGRFTPEVTGTYFWVETLIAENGRILHMGECGAPTEISVVTPMPPIAEAGGFGVVHIIGSSLLVGSGLVMILFRRKTKIA